MFKPRKFKLAADEIVGLLARPMGSGMASDHITVEGRLVGYMYREQPNHDTDSGWCFLSGDESQEYADNPDNWAIYDLNTIANYDPAIVAYLDCEYGTELKRVAGTDQFCRVR
jgi:hypothetical protein